MDDNNDGTVIDNTNISENKIEGSTLKVLVVVDVQDCFMSNLLSNDNFLNFGIGKQVEEKLKLSGKMVKEISELSKKNDIVFFTRDMHPQNHISFEGDEGRPLDPASGYWPHHCRTNEVCGKRTEAADTEGNIREPSENLTTLTQMIRDNIQQQNTTNILSEIGPFNITDENGEKINTDNVPIKGNQLSYFFYFTPLANTVFKFNNYLTFV
jgi:hypothetical protein